MHEFMKYPKSGRRFDFHYTQQTQSWRLSFFWHRLLCIWQSFGVTRLQSMPHLALNGCLLCHQSTDGFFGRDYGDHSLWMRRTYCVRMELRNALSSKQAPCQTCYAFSHHHDKALSISLGCSHRVSWPYAKLQHVRFQRKTRSS